VSSFGDYLRAGRLGYGWVDQIKAFVRITGPYADTNPWRVEFAHNAREMAAQGRDHRCWWDNDKDGARLVSVCEAVRTWDGKPGALWVDEDGKKIKEG
jgi:hypothetical protein